MRLDIGSDTDRLGRCVAHGKCSFEQTDEQMKMYESRVKDEDRLMHKTENKRVLVVCPHDGNKVP